MTEKPGIDHLKVGDEVVVVEKLHRAEDRLTPVRITKTNRVWWEFEELHPRISEYTGHPRNPRVWRMRKTTQHEGDHHGDRFATAEQLAWEDRNRAADRYLWEIGLSIYNVKVTLDKLTLANLIRNHLGLEEI